jgi:hypothetical protein
VLDWEAVVGQDVALCLQQHLDQLGVALLEEPGDAFDGLPGALQVGLGKDRAQGGGWSSPDSVDT